MEHIYLVGKGEFELARVLKGRGNNSNAVGNLISHERKHVFAQRFEEIKDIPNRQRLAILGPGQLVGHEVLLLFGSQHSCTLRCVSEKGLLYLIKPKHFLEL